jgi:hypothetical protein
MNSLSYVSAGWVCRIMAFAIAAAVPGLCIAGPLSITSDGVVVQEPPMGVTGHSTLVFTLKNTSTTDSVSDIALLPPFLGLGTGDVDDKVTKVQLPIDPGIPNRLLPGSLFRVGVLFDYEDAKQFEFNDQGVWPVFLIANYTFGLSGGPNSTSSASEIGQITVTDKPVPEPTGGILMSAATAGLLVMVQSRLVARRPAA